MRRSSVIRGVLVALLFAVPVALLLAVFIKGCADTTRIVLNESELPSQQLYVLSNGERVEYVLPNGRYLCWRAEKNALPVGEQVTVSGLKAHVQEPSFNELNDDSVCTSTNEEVSIYSFSIDGYRVQRAEDLRAADGLPIIIRVFRIGKAEELDHAAVRGVFNERAGATTKPRSSAHVPIPRSAKLPSA